MNIINNIYSTFIWLGKKARKKIIKYLYLGNTIIYARIYWTFTER